MEVGGAGVGTGAEGQEMGGARPTWMIWDLLMCISVAEVNPEDTRRIASAWAR